MRTALVTGALGFIGRNLCNKLESLGVIVNKVDNMSLGKPKIGDRFIWSGTEDPRLLPFVLSDNLDYIFHFGSPCSVLQYGEDPVKALKETVLGFKNMLDLAKYTKARLVYPSSGNVYGNIEPPYDERINPNPTNLYGMGKLICEKMAVTSSYNDIVGLRIFTSYGPGEERKKGFSSIPHIFLKEMMEDRKPVIWGNGEQKRDCIYIDDLVECIVKVANHIDPPKIMNVGTGIEHSYNEIVEIINKVLGTEIEPIYKHTSKPLGYVDRAFCDTYCIKKYTEIVPRNLEEGIRKFYSYLSDNDGRQNN